MRLEHNLNADHAKGKKTEEKPKERLSKFKDFIEKSREAGKKALTCSLIAAAVVFTVKCGNPSDNPNTDADASDSHEGVLDGFEDDTHDEDLLDIIEEGDVPEADTVDEDVEGEELPPLECPSPVEETEPDINDVFEANVADYVTSTGGEVSADADLYMSMVPDSYNECLNAGEGGYELVCVDDTVNIDGEYYLAAENVDALLPAASSIDDVCTTVTEDYPLLVYAGVTPEIIKNAVYDFGSYTVDSIAGFSMNEPGSFYFDVDGARNDVASISFSHTASGIYPITFKRDAAPITFNARSFDGRGSEATNSYNADMSEGSSKPLYVAAVNATDDMHYSVEGIPPVYGNSWYDIIICTRLSSGVRTDSVILSLDELEGSSTFDITCPITHGDCGCMGEEVTLSISNIVSSGVPIGGDMAVAVTLLTPTISGPDDIPEIQIDYTYSGSGSMGLDLDVDVIMTLNIDGTNVCSGGAPFHEHFRFAVIAWDPASEDYLAECGGSMDPST